MIELGRACVHRDHRHLAVIALLWRGIAGYALQRVARYLVGCSSLNSQDVGVASATHALFETQGCLAGEEFRTRPHPAFRCEDAPPASPCPRPPRLLRTYLALGAKICAPPAIDREFGTIDF